MKDAAKLLTEESGSNDEAIEVWESGIDALIASVARYL